MSPGEEGTEHTAVNPGYFRPPEPCLYHKEEHMGLRGLL